MCEAITTKVQSREEVKEGRVQYLVILLPECKPPPTPNCLLPHKAQQTMPFTKPAVTTLRTLLSNIFLTPNIIQDTQP